MGLLLKQTFESCVLTHLYPHSEIQMNVQVLSNDEGARMLSMSNV